LQPKIPYQTDGIPGPSVKNDLNHHFGPASFVSRISVNVRVNGLSGSPQSGTTCGLQRSGLGMDSD
jgi:hypothetical protein